MIEEVGKAKTTIKKCSQGPEATTIQGWPVSGSSFMWACAPVTRKAHLSKLPTAYSWRRGTTTGAGNRKKVNKSQTLNQSNWRRVRKASYSSHWKFGYPCYQRKKNVVWSVTLLHLWTRPCNSSTVTVAPRSARGKTEAHRRFRLVPHSLNPTHRSL